MKTIPYIAHESAMYRLERVNLRLAIAAGIAIIALIATNAAWIFHFFRL